MVITTQQKTIRPGYKKTEVGVIPEDWGVEAFKDMFSISAGGDFDPRLSSGEYDDTHVYPVYSNALTNAGVYGYCSYSDHKAGSITVTARGTLGVAHYRDREFTAVGRVLVLEPRKKLDGRFFAEYINDRVRFAIESTGVPQLTAPQISKYKLPVPPPIEQSGIATALAGVDALIASLAALLAKQHDLKTAVMRELLAGKRRLPGFSGEWKLKRLGSLGTFRGGNGFPTKYQGDVEGDYPFFKVSDMNNEGNSKFMIASNNWISENTRKRIGANIFPAKTVVFAKIGAAIFLERKKILSRDSCIDNNMMGFVVDEGLADPRFVHCLLLNSQLGKLIAATALPSLNGRDIAALEFGIPRIPEQRAIAAVLSDMDLECAALETRREKTQALKQGMMQQLLTGHIRLI